ncbi:MAG: hypothetical protein Q9165_008082 [Trypethelium subeluteriae]
MSQPDLSIPSKAPALTRRHEDLPNALYSLVPLSDEDLKVACDYMNREHRKLTDQEPIHPAPNADFAGHPLRDVFNHHLELGHGGQWDPIYFLTITTLDWRATGILLVTMSNKQDEKPDLLFIDPEQARLKIASMDVGNTTWEDELESNWGSPRDGLKKGTGPRQSKSLQDEHTDSLAE